jgi:hypothetical protein
LFFPLDHVDCSTYHPTMDENLALEEKAVAGDSVSIEVLRSMRSELQREVEAVKAQSQYTLNGNDSSFDMEEDLQENVVEPPVQGDSQADNEADNDGLPIPMWQTLLPMEGDTAAGTSSDAKSTARGYNVPIRCGSPSRPLLLQTLCPGSTLPAKTFIYPVVPMIMSTVD